MAWSTVWESNKKLGRIYPIKKKKITKEASETRGCENKRFRLLVWTPPPPPPASEVDEKPLQEQSRDLTGYELHHSETTLVAG